MTDIPAHRRSPLDHGRDEPDLSDEALDAIRAEVMTWTDADGIEWIMAAGYAALARRAVKLALEEAAKAADAQAAPVAGTPYSVGGRVFSRAIRADHAEALARRAVKLALKEAADVAEFLGDPAPAIRALDPDAILARAKGE
jgi:hypothetical protein